MKMSIEEAKQDNEKFIQEMLYEKYNDYDDYYSYSLMKDEKLRNLAVVLSQKTINEIIEEGLQQINDFGFDVSEIKIRYMNFYTDEVVMCFELPTGQTQEARVKYRKLEDLSKDEFEKFKKIQENLAKLRKKIAERLEREREEYERRKKIEKKIKEYDELKEKVERLQSEVEEKEEKIKTLTELIKSELSEDQIRNFFIKKISEEQIQQIKEEYSELFEDEDEY